MTEEKLKEKIIFYNPWWQGKSVPSALAPSFRRKVFAKLKKYLQLERIIVLKGPRRTGKSTLIYQLIDKLIKNGIDPSRILYLNFEDSLLRIDLYRLFRAFEKIILQTLDKGSEKYIFLDEIHLLPNWANTIKAFFDKKYPLKFICSGSATSLIQKESESLAGRTIEEIVLPFSFPEWINYHRKELNIPKITFKNYPLFQKGVEILWQQYLEKGGFAHLLAIKERVIWQKLIFEDVVEKVIYKDLVDLYNIREPALLEKVFHYLAETSSEILNLTSLGATIGLNRETLRVYLSYLKRAFLYFELPKFSYSVKQMLASSVKVHLIDAGLFNLIPEKKLAKIWESVIACHLWQKYPRTLFYWREKEEVDLVLQREKTLIPIEIKSGQKLDKKDLKGMFKFMRKFKVEKGLVIYDGKEKEETMRSKLIKFIPAQKFLLFSKKYLF